MRIAIVDESASRASIIGDGLGPLPVSELFVLSERESEILDLVAQGMRNKEIASKLCIAEKTVKNHVSNILKALQVNSRTEAAMKAVRSRLVDKA